jgi:hypothetical protein
MPSFLALPALADLNCETLSLVVTPTLTSWL